LDIIVGGLASSHIWALVNNPCFFYFCWIDHILIMRLLCLVFIYNSSCVVKNVFFIINIFHFCLLKKTY